MTQKNVARICRRIGVQHERPSNLVALSTLISESISPREHGSAAVREYARR
ncbi:MAG: hypothetical protein E7J96_07620 [Actinomyces sp.]|nr:hypothetical protein [Actinomyces sp.]